MIALGCTRLFVHSAMRMYVPILFTVVLVAIAARFGLVASLLGAVLSAAVFAYFLYPPLRSLQVDEAAARDSLSWMILSAAVLSFLLFPPRRPRPAARNQGAADADAGGSPTDSQTRQ